MPVTEVHHDENALTLTMVAEFAAPPERVWQVYADPRQLEKIWGPPGYPATVVDHDMRPGGKVTYFMTSPEGEKYCGFWVVTDVDEPRSFGFHDYFSDEEFNRVDEMPAAHNVYTFTAIDGGTRAEYVGTYESLDGLKKVLEMGVVEGATGAIGQIDELLAGETSVAS
ncbi:uncharacterized protein YndB with AHSA1/START domain [Brevibacterium sanguinis]|uniref:Uncharacterized protein YndB with AHSA1/START domain n=2 Tax=Brevibacterium TaxID=1696 RepID=A0A366ILA1_9MICO|nr:MULTISPECIES: SRPBCC domain-containing protein [Brevibacterium]RBP66961.1 uncharacterized protein YndB with AHSA1/START domain [Brevibacterium sanguinis]RBP73486.1 uncharacterized protein YndB with AHSA1/START domain [Brevibacterium celere]